MRACARRAGAQTHRARRARRHSAPPQPSQPPALQPLRRRHSPLRTAAERAAAQQPAAAQAHPAQRATAAVRGAANAQPQRQTASVLVRAWYCPRSMSSTAAAAASSSACGGVRRGKRLRRRCASAGGAPWGAAAAPAAASHAGGCPVSVAKSRRHSSARTLGGIAAGAAAQEGDARVISSGRGRRARTAALRRGTALCWACSMDTRVSGMAPASRQLLACSSRLDERCRTPELCNAALQLPATSPPPLLHWPPRPSRR